MLFKCNPIKMVRFNSIFFYQNLTHHQITSSRLVNCPVKKFMPTHIDIHCPFVEIKRKKNKKTTSLFHLLFVVLTVTSDALCCSVYVCLVCFVCFVCLIHLNHISEEIPSNTGQLLGMKRHSFHPAATAYPLLNFALLITAHTTCSLHPM